MNDRSVDHRVRVQTAIVVHPVRPRAEGLRSPEQRLEEAVGLAEALDLEIVEALVAPLRTTVPATLFGKGKVEEVGTACRGLEIDVVVVDGTVGQSMS